jgi:ubiquinone/menaquinone biosynthesis C-methylase UbiE
MKEKSQVAQEIIDFYEHASEEDRLKFGLGPLEFERNQELIGRFLPQDTGTVLDIGGGPGIYSEWLADLGFEVYLVDPVQKHIRQAKKRAKNSHCQYTCVLGDSKKLDFRDNFCDLVIMHGPLYHLQTREERLKSLNEAKRVLKPSGILLGFAINYTASTFVGLTQGVFFEAPIQKMCMEELTTGLHSAPPDMPGVLPKAFYHRPGQLIEEVEKSGFELTGLFAVEGVIWLDKKYFETRSDPDKKQQAMEFLRKTETDRNLLALSPHMMVAGRKR